MINPKDAVWTEKYRPKQINEIVGDFKDKVRGYMSSPKSFPNLLLYSKSPGTGKTTLAKAIINELGCDALVLNSSDDRKLETVRAKVKQFALTKSSKEDMKRAVFMDEFDGMLKASQDALRNVMETYASNVFFIMTCNNINKVIEPIRSRCMLVTFAYPNKEEVKKYLTMICHNEDMVYTDEGIDALVKLNYPNIRNCVLALQDLYTEGVEVNEKTVKKTDELFGELWIKLKEKKWIDIKAVVLEGTVDARELNTYFWHEALKEENVNLRLIQICCRNEKDIAWGADSKVVFVTSLIELVK